MTTNEIPTPTLQDELRAQSGKAFGPWELCLRAATRLDEIEAKLRWLDEVGPPNHPDDERHWAMAYVHAKAALAASEKARWDAAGTIERLEGNIHRRALAHSALAQRAESLSAALQEVDGCFEAAYVEGLSERLAEADNSEPGSLADLIKRRLLPARDAALAALALPVDKS